MLHPVHSGRRMHAADKRAMLAAGADKISLNRLLSGSTSMITHTSRIYGSQLIVVAIGRAQGRWRS